MNATQLDLFRTVPQIAGDLPDGLLRADDFLSRSQECALVQFVQALPFAPFEFHGFLGKRRVVSFGRRYDFASERLLPAGDMPQELALLRERAAGFAGVDPADIVHALVTEYAPGAAIGWHRDKANFDVVIGVSLLAPCVFRLRRRSGAGFDRASFAAAPRSIYVLRGAARSEWEHSIPPLDALRYSITFRTLRA